MVSLFLCGLDFNPDRDKAKRASYAFLRTVVGTAACDPP
jgi:hypothetical protein